MPFTYPDAPHARKHGPTGYSDYKRYKPWLRDDFIFRCVYCLERELWYPSGKDAFGVEHVLPKSDPAYAALECAYDNLVYACNRCNSVKGKCVLLDPCAAALGQHLRVASDGRMTALTPEGKYLINRLGLDRKQRRKVRNRFLRILRLYQKQPNDPDVREFYFDYFAYPDDLPNLDRLEPETNTRPEGMPECYFRQRQEGRLPADYL
jgi:hypothetical protein